MFEEYGNPRAAAEAGRIRDRFRLLWEQHVYWTRIVILGIAFDSPDLAASTARLLQNATDFGAAFRRFYGPAAGRRLEGLIHDHLTIAGDLVQAAKAGNNAATAAAERRWYQNVDEIATYLGRLNPAWRGPAMRSMWHEHLALTKREAVQILNRQYPASIETFNEIERLALRMADDMSNGIIMQMGI